MNDLLDAACAKHAITSDRALSRLLGIHHSDISAWRNGKAFPADHHVARLADLAGQDALYWLLRLNEVRTTGPTSEHYSKAAKARASDLGK